MKHTSFRAMHCPIARSLEQVGEWWSILIIRDAVYGLTRFDHFQKSLEIPPSMLTRRLGQLVKAGLLRKERYSARPARYEYRLTDKGRDFGQVLLALTAFGNKHLAPDGESIVLTDPKSGRTLDPVLVDRQTREPLVPGQYELAAGPAASGGVRLRMALAAGEMPADQYIAQLVAWRQKPRRARKEKTQ